MALAGMELQASNPINKLRMAFTTLSQVLI